ncbi:MAG: hypothetical protein S0880_36960 [Actinomycetota bacterium]|nr:hypothetical protein [Actinomycetota bacterium]
MTFGRQPGPPASHREVERLLDLLHDAGHADFRDARGSMGFTQRQAAGKFTRDEAAAFIVQLEAEAEAGEGHAEPRPAPERLTATDRALRTIPTEALAAELQRRGWVAIEP